MRIWKRALAVLLALFCLISVLCACGNERQEQKVIGTCAGFDVLYEELRYLTLTYKDIFEDTYGEGIWDNPETAEKYRAELEETVFRLILNNYAALRACQHYMGEEETKKAMKDQDIRASVDAQIQEVKQSYGSKGAFKDAMKENHLTEHFWRFTLTVAQLENELYYVLTDDLGLIEKDHEAFYNWLRDGNSVYVQHIFVENNKGEDKEANRQKAEQIRDTLISSADPAALVLTLANDSNTDEDYYNVDPYYIVRDVYTEEVEEAAFSLSGIGSVSDVVEVETGFYVLVQVADEEPTLLSKTPSLLYSYQWAKLEAIIEGFKSEIQLELNEYGKSIDLLAIR
ncbi:MAG: peptidylprolyl isomerase [Clostridia bacterium]|nr:peptidylprolyl isomerase [Clostridia bacterium]